MALDEVRTIGARLEEVVAKGIEQAHWQGYAASVEHRGDDGGEGNVLPFPRH